MRLINKDNVQLISVCTKGCHACFSLYVLAHARESLGLNV